MPILVLSKSQASRIAAGEVIDRPVSVVKELIENSLDAGASRISVNIEQGGTRLISVADNGCGIASSEIAMAFERFATSKLTSSSSLNSIESLGFRGEALPSIAAVAQVEVLTSTGKDMDSARCECSYGGKPIVNPAGYSQGTEVTVRNLFKNLPARLKFLSSESNEASRIVRLVANFALVYPNVAFMLNVDSKKRLNTQGIGDLQSTANLIYGNSVYNMLMPIKQLDATSAFKVNGIVSAPEITRRSRNAITVSVNNRWVANSKVIFSVKQAYASYIPENRYPIAIVAIHCPLTDVDVNVHPSKAEVRFLREDLVFSMVQVSIRDALVKSSPIPKIKNTLTPQEEKSGRLWRLNPAWPVSPQNSSPQHTTVDSIKSDVTRTTDIEPNRTDNINIISENVTHKEVIPTLRVIGQVHSTYIVADGVDGIYLLDQHAAHERVVYENLMNQSKKDKNRKHTLLVPELIEIEPHLTDVLYNAYKVFEENGFVIEGFGERSIVIREVPRLMVNKDNVSFSKTIIDMLDSIYGNYPPEHWRARILATAACHSSVRAGQSLVTEECIRIVEELEKCEHPTTCPHGRPTMLHLSQAILETNFGRK